jgi:hypothetical protein
MYYNDSSNKEIREGNWDVRHSVSRIGGYTLLTANLPASLAYLAKGAVVSISAAGAKLLKSVKVYEAASKSATTLKIEKGSAVIVGDVIGGATVSAIASSESYDTLTVDALQAAAKVGDVLSEKVDGLTLALNEVTRPVKGTPEISVTLQAYEIEEDSLPYPVNDEIKAALTVRHAFKV